MNGFIENGAELHKEKSRYPMKTQIKIVLQAYTHITQVKLPDISKKLTEAFNGWLNVPEDDLKAIDDLHQIFQYANIILDDIQDDRNSRDGIQSAHSAYGIAHALNGYGYALLDFEKKVLGLDSSGDMYRLYIELQKNTCLARCMQLYWRNTVSCPTEEQYYQMIVQKTYLLVTAKIKFLQALSKNKTDLVKLAGMFGLYFQIRDDYRRLTVNDETSELYCEDITLGKFSLPLIYAIKTHPNQGEVILDILRLRSKDKNIKQYVVSLLEQCGSFEYTKRVLRQLKAEILEEVKKHGKNHLIEKFMDEYFDSSLDKSENCTTATSTNRISSFILQMNKTQSPEELNFQVKKVLKPYRHIDSISGKNFREGLVRLFKRILHIPDEKAALIEHTEHYIHVAALLIDDIQDASDLRRGIPAAHHIFGITNVVNSAYFIVADLEEKLFNFNEPKVFEICTTLTETMIRGQAMEIYWRENFICPNEAEWLEMVDGKAGAPFMIAAKLLKLFSSVTKSPERLMSVIGQFFQINDDYQNLTNQAYFDRKGFCEDLTEGKFSFPVIHAVDTHPKEGQIIIDILRRRTQDMDTKKYCLGLLKQCGSFDYTMNRLNELRDIIGQEIGDYGESKSLFEFLEQTIFKNTI